ncbi:multidrug transporter [Pseudomonas sp. CAU 1711]|uniref:multidrug transporter n=1 Tax=Pseudomonas sp. CAU 1711 TaxID=3140356 RepID=UPI003260296F
MNLFRTTAAVLALTTGLLALPAQAQEVVQQNVSGDPTYTVNTPKGYAMAGDLIIARPLLIAGTVIGAGMFLISLPFTAAGGNVKEAGQALVVEPGMAAFVRCLGCTESGYKKD